MMSKDSDIQATVIILTKNEERHIQRAIKSAKDFAEILVIDSDSEDETARLAKADGATLINFIWDGLYPKKKEWSLQHAAHDWVFYLDADEFFEFDLVEEIREAITIDSCSVIEVPLKYFWASKELKFGHRVSKRIGMKRSASYWPRPDDLHVKNMWEVEGHYQPQCRSGNTVRLRHELGHLDEDGLYDYFSRHNRYSDWEAHMLYAKDRDSLVARSTLGRIAVKLPAKPAVFFLYSFIAKRGFLDGRAGFDYAVALSTYYWQIGVKMREIKTAIGQ